MAKFITNESSGIICIGDKNFIPGAGPVLVTDEEAAHPTIAAYIKVGKLTLEEGEETDTNLDSMTVAQLKAYAASPDKNIDLSDAKTKPDILAAIKAAEAGE